jgi:hypothetical protein
MATQSGDPDFTSKPSGPEIRDADPSSVVSEGDSSSVRQASIQNGNTEHRRKDSEVPAKISVRRSGGPRTERGKEKSSRNAIKHGIFSTVVLPGWESRKEYQGLLHALIDDIKPEGYMQRMLVEKFAANFWRQSRLVRAESAEILSASEQARMEMVLDSGRDRQKRETEGGMIADGANSASLERGIELLRELRARVEKHGFNWDADGDILFKLYGPIVEHHLPDIGFVMYRFWIKCSELYAENVQPKAGISLEESKKQAIDTIDTEISYAETRRQILKSFEDKHKLLKLTRATSMSPSEIALEKVIRYEVHLGREFDRILQQLERLRKIRTGQLLPGSVR